MKNVRNEEGNEFLSSSASSEIEGTGPRSGSVGDSGSGLIVVSSLTLAGVWSGRRGPDVDPDKSKSLGCCCLPRLANLIFSLLMYMLQPDMERFS